MSYASTERKSQNYQLNTHRTEQNTTEIPLFFKKKMAQWNLIEILIDAEKK